MAVLDVTIPTGYIVQQQDLDAYIISRRVRNLQRAKFLERKVFFYFDYVSIFKFPSGISIVNFSFCSWTVRTLALTSQWKGGFQWRICPDI